MGKRKKERRLAEYEAMAVTRSLRVSPQKLNLVAQMVRGKKVSRAVNDLQFSRKRIAREVLKTLNSAIANAENNHGLEIDNLIVAEAYVGKNLVMKRWKPRARGRVGRILKPFSQLTIIVRDEEMAKGAQGKAGNAQGDNVKPRAKAAKSSKSVDAGAAKKAGAAESKAGETGSGERASGEAASGTKGGEES
jgi:large subunit ribosomal protein L22